MIIHLWTFIFRESPLISIPLMNVLNFDLISSSSLTQGDVQHIMWISRHLNSAWFIYRWKLPSICHSPIREARLHTVTLPQPTAACKSTWRHMAWKIFISNFWTISWPVPSLLQFICNLNVWNVRLLVAHSSAMVCCFLPYHHPSDLFSHSHTQPLPLSQPVQCDRVPLL